jgi:hypothetical protein
MDASGDVASCVDTVVAEDVETFARFEFEGAFVVRDAEHTLKEGMRGLPV